MLSSKKAQALLDYKMADLKEVYQHLLMRLLKKMQKLY